MNLCSSSFTWPEDVRGLLRMSQGSWHLSLAALTVNVASNIGAPQWSSYCSIPIKQKLNKASEPWQHVLSKVTPKLLDYTIVCKAWNHGIAFNTYYAHQTSETTPDMNHEVSIEELLPLEAFIIDMYKPNQANMFRSGFRSVSVTSKQWASKDEMARMSRCAGGGVQWQDWSSKCLSGTVVLLSASWRSPQPLDCSGLQRSLS